MSDDDRLSDQLAEDFERMRPSAPEPSLQLLDVFDDDSDDDDNESENSSDDEEIRQRREEARRRAQEKNEAKKEMDSMGNESWTGPEKSHFASLPPLLRAKLFRKEEDRAGAANTAQREENFLGSLPSRYQELRKIGFGYNGIVYSAQETTDEGEKRPVAIKFLEQRRLGHEYRKTREFSVHGLIPPHPNIVQLLSHEKILSTGLYDYFVMELCDKSLDDWIKEVAQKRKGPSDVKLPPAMSPAAVVHLLHELTDAVNALKTFNVTHRDVKPSNILLCQREVKEGEDDSFPFVAKLSDFGLSDRKLDHVVESYPGAYVGVKLDSDSGYTHEQDYRAAVASVFFAWIGSSEWNVEAARA